MDQAYDNNIVLAVIDRYAKTWRLLWQYDEASLAVHGLPGKKEMREQKIPELTTVRRAIGFLKERLLEKGEATDIFGRERGDALAGILGAIRQTFGGRDVYPLVAEKAAHLLYFIVKDHPFTDGNKRIGAFLFVLFLRENGFSSAIPDSRGLVALTLLIAASPPEQKDLLIRLVMNLLYDE